MQTAELLGHLEVESARLRAAAARDLGAEVPSCPGWVVRDLVEHVAEVYEHKLACIALGGPKPEPWPPVWPAERDPLAWLDDVRARLLTVLRDVDPAAPSWTWLPEDQTAGFWHRRMAHESAVHRVDAELAHGAATEVDAELALDGIDELLRLMLDEDWTGFEEPELTGSLVVASSGRAWGVVMTADVIVVSDALPDGSQATVSGDPSGLLLWLYGRAPASVVSVDGDPVAAQRLRQRVALSTV